MKTLTFLHSSPSSFPTAIPRFSSFFNPPSSSHLLPPTLHKPPTFLHLHPRHHPPFIPKTHSMNLHSSPHHHNSSSTHPPPRKGARPLRLLFSIFPGLVFLFLIPKPHQLSSQAWRLLSIFISTITGLILSPLPVSAWSFLSLTFTILTKTLPISSAFSAFTNEVIWLIVISFFFARGFLKTGLADRIATFFLSYIGHTTLGLSYGLTLSEAIIAPAMPSTTARAGGIFLPIIKSLSASSEIGPYLIHSQLQSASNSSALFLTAAAQNLLCIKLAEQLGVRIRAPWVSWLKYAFLPAVVSILVTPLILYRITPPGVKRTPEAPAAARRRLEEMGGVKKEEWVMVFAAVVAVGLWVSGQVIGVASVTAAMLGLCILLLAGVLEWNDCLQETAAWDTLVWFAVVVGMAGQLTSLGVVGWVSGCVGGWIKGMKVGWGVAFVVLQGVYFVVHYLFASQTAHVGALYSAFLGMQLEAGVPGLLAVFTLAFNTNLFGALTHYSSGQAAVYYGAGYVKLPQMFKVGIIMAVVNVGIWAALGCLWWKLLRLY